jgi:hypothetical protein
MADPQDPFGYLDQPPPQSAQQPQPPQDPYGYLGPATPPPPPPPTWGETAGNALHAGSNFARVAASQIPLWDRARALAEYPVLSGGMSYNEAVNKEAAATQKARSELGPFFSSTADIAGGGALGSGLAKSGLTLMGDASRPLLQRIGTGMAEAGLYGGAQAANQTYTGNLPDYIKNAAWGTTAGMALGSALPVIGSAAEGLYKNVSDRFSGIPPPVLRAGASDATGLANLSALGPDAMLLDAGPSMLGTAQAASQGVGDSRTAIVNALVDRNAGTTAGLQADRAAALGPAPRVSQIENTIDQGRQAINANDYAPVLQGRAMNPQGADSVMGALDALGRSTRIDMGGVRNALTLPGSQTLPDLSPQSWLQARHNIDSMITVANKQGDRYRAGVLNQAREMVDNELSANVPGIKAADAKWAANRAELEALQTGQTLLDKGKNAIAPDDLRDLLTAAPTAVKARFQQGAHADLERRLGQNANDLATLKATIGTPEDWNAQKMRMVFGPQAAQAVTDSVDRHKVFQNSYDQVVGGPNTAQKLSGREDVGFTPPSARGGETLFGTIKQAGEWTLGKMTEASREQQRNEIARIMSLRDPAQVAAMRDKILTQNAYTAQMGPRVSQATQAALQGGVSSLLPPIFVNQENQ